MARMVSGKVLPWQRFWVPQGGRITAGDDGRSFLDDPEGEFGLSRNPEVVKIEDLLQRPCVVLSGQPGIGKTVEFNSLRDRRTEWLAPDEALIDFHCRHVTSPEALRLETVESLHWKRALENGGKIRLLIDGVDEALSRVSVLVPALAQWLRDEPLDRIRLILVCRSAEWHLADTEALRELWNEKHERIVFELCPLRWKDAELAARESGVDPQSFWQEIVRHQVKGLAARPITLGMLLEEMNEGGSLPSSHHQLFANAIVRICRENPERARYAPRARPNPTHIERVASRIAMLLMIGGRSVIARDGDDAQLEELLVSDIATGTETVSGETFSVTPELVGATLDTALFSFRGPDRYGFDHQTFAEHLAADYLQDCSLTQLRRLLCVSFGGREFVAPQLAEIAARVGLTNETWCDHLIQSEPEILLRADATQLDATQKERAVTNLLKRAEQEEAFDALGSTKFYHTLKHPGLGDQLRKYINEPKYNYVVRRMAFEIAGDAQVTELEADLWNRVKAQDPCLNNICHALADIAGPASREPLIAALRGQMKDNLVFDLKGLALSKLVPETFTIREVLPFLTSQPADTISGMYQMELRYHLPEQVTIDDVVPLLALVESSAFSRDPFRGLGKLTARAVELAFENFDKEHIVEALAKAIRNCGRAHGSFFGNVTRGDRDPLQALEDPVKRRALAKQLLVLPESDQHDLYLSERRLLVGEDLEWLLRELPEISPNQRLLWSKVIGGLVWQDLTGPVGVLFARRYEEYEELREVLPKPGRFGIATTIERLRRSSQLRQERRQRFNARRWRKRTRAEVLARVWRAFDAGNSTAWVGFCDGAYQTEDNDSKPVESSDHADITSSPAWRSLDLVQRGKLRAAARLFLREHRDDDRKPDEWSNFASAACYAISLFRDEIKSDAALRLLITERWPSIIFDSSDHDGSVQDETLAVIYRVLPHVGAARLAVKMRAEDRRGGYLGGLSRYASCWDAQLSDVVREFLLHPSSKPASLRHAFEFLRKHDRSLAARIFAELIQRKGIRPFNARGRALLAVGLFLFTKENWNKCWAELIELPEPIARRLILEAASDFLDRRHANFDEELTTRQITDLLARVLEWFPSTTYSEHHSPEGHVGARHYIPGLRQGLLHSLVTRATPEACNSLQLLAENAPVQDRLDMHWRYHEAVINALRKIWTGRPRTSSDLLAMTRDYRTLTVDTDDELLEAVLASLERLQDRIHVAESPELRALWNEPRTGGTPSHKSEEVLSDTIADWLRRDLGRGSGIILNREVRATRLGRLDIKVEAAPRKRNVNLLTLAIEIKGDWNRKIATSLGTQLVGKYLQTNGWTHGIYLIGWFQHNNQSRKLPGWSPTDINDARQIVLWWQADQTPVGLTVQPLVLDCSLSPARSAIGDRSFESRRLESKTLCMESTTKSSS